MAEVSIYMEYDKSYSCKVYRRIMIKNKYKFLKKLYPNDIIIFLKKNTYYVYYEDVCLLKKVKRYRIINYLNMKHINYIIIDNLDIVEHKIFDDNKYRRLYRLTIIRLIINMSKGSSELGG